MADGSGEMEVEVVRPLEVVGKIPLPPCPFCGEMIDVEIRAGIGRVRGTGTIAIMHDHDMSDAAAHLFTHDVERGIHQ